VSYVDYRSVPVVHVDRAYFSLAVPSVIKCRGFAHS
jgi:hypothetical protein